MLTIRNQLLSAATRAANESSLLFLLLSKLRAARERVSRCGGLAHKKELVNEEKITKVKLDYHYKDRHDNKL